jgi:TRAP-type mannitol/chloroaromatic compound transport system permease small subunit
MNRGGGRCPPPSDEEPTVKTLLALIDGTNTWIGKVTSILSLVVALIIFYEIIVREFLHSPTTWVSEATVFGCGLLYMLGGAWTLKQDGHVRVDMLYHGLSRRGKAIIDCVTYFAFLLYISVMIWAAWQYMMQSIAVRETTMSPWDPVIWPLKIALVVSLIMLLLQQTAKFVRDFYYIVKGEEL